MIRRGMECNAQRERRRPLVTWLLVAANVAVFVLEVFKGGSTNPLTLLRLGAAELWAIRGGQWWRILSANFLHFGVTHLVINMASLLIVGPFVEQTLGRIGYALLYI